MLRIAKLYNTTYDFEAAEWFWGQYKETTNYEEFRDKYPQGSKGAQLFERFTLKDNKKNRIAEALMNNGELQCLLDERSDCVHVGFVYSLPELYGIINSKRIKVPSSAL